MAGNPLALRTSEGASAVSEGVTKVINQGRVTVNRRLGRVSKKTGKRGKTGYSIEVDAEPIVCHYRDDVMQPVAEAMAAILREKLGSSNSPVKPATSESRGVAERAYTKGSKWAKRRYSGGRIGDTPPVSGERSLFRHSGRLRDSVRARYVAKKKAVFIDVAGNRLKPSADFGGEGQFRNMLRKLVSLIPEFDSKRFLQSKHGKKAMEEVSTSFIQVENANLSAKMGQLRSVRRQAIKRLGAAGLSFL